MKIAVFDVDGTLIEDNIGITFIKYLNKIGEVRLLQKIIVLVGYGLYKARILDFRAAIALGYIAFAGRQVSVVESFATDCFERIIKPKLYLEGIDEIDRLKKTGFKIILATGAHSVIAKPLSAYLASDILICTESKVFDGVFGWSKAKPIPYREAKRDLVSAEISARFASEANEIVVYTDEEKDLSLLDLSNDCVGVNPDSVIEAAVRAKGGRILRFERTKS